MTRSHDLYDLLAVVISYCMAGTLFFFFRFSSFLLNHIRERAERNHSTIPTCMA